MREREFLSGGELGVGAGVPFSVTVPDVICDGGGETERRMAVCALDPSITDMGVAYDVDGVAETVV